MREAYDKRYWEDYTADHIGAIHYMLSHIGDTTPSASGPELYSSIVHKGREKRSEDKRSSKEIIGYIRSKL